MGRVVVFEHTNGRTRSTSTVDNGGMVETGQKETKGKEKKDPKEEK